VHGALIYNGSSKHAFLFLLSFYCSFSLIYKQNQVMEIKKNLQRWSNSSVVERGIAVILNILRSCVRPTFTPYHFFFSQLFRSCSCSCSCACMFSFRIIRAFCLTSITIARLKFSVRFLFGTQGENAAVQRRKARLDLQRLISDTSYLTRTAQ
jgi:hypothetical protein